MKTSYSILDHDLLVDMKQDLSLFPGWICFLLFLLAGSGPLLAQQDGELKPGAIFQDNMVIQREKPIKIWGYAPHGNRVVVEMRSQVSGRSLETAEKAIALSDEAGKWEVELPSLSHKGPYKIHLSSGSQEYLIQNILVGDVWIASGQSNMEWPVSNTDFRETDSIWMAKAEFRMIKVIPEMDSRPRRDNKETGWRQLSPENINEFSAVAYQFGKELHRDTEVPIGLISANLGATTIETWMSNEALSQFPQFRKEVQHSGSFRELNAAFENGSGEWDKKEYYSGSGFQQKWYADHEKDSPGWEKITVAGNTWEEVEDLRDFDGAVWFRKRFDLPEAFSGDSLSLQLLQIDDHDITWINGKKVGETFGRHNHRNYKVGATALQEKDNMITIRVFDAGGAGGFTTNAFWGNELLWGEWEYRKGKEVDASVFRSPDLPNASPFSSPGVLYNGTIAPLTNIGIKGVIWYQGESNELRAQEYRKLFSTLIKDWRGQFRQGDFPFLFVQLANYREEIKQPGPSTWAEIREAQALALNEPNTGMAVAIDLGEAGDIHPRNKKDVGKRLGLLAKNLVYGSEVLSRSPQYREMKLEGENVILTFDHVGKGFESHSKSGHLRGFQIAGADQVFHWAEAVLVEDNQVIVSSEHVEKPIAVRYAWSDNPGKLDLYNSNNLPLVPFRTDDWPLSTDGKLFEEGPRF